MIFIIKIRKINRYLPSLQRCDYLLMLFQESYILYYKLYSDFCVKNFNSNLLITLQIFFMVVVAF